MNHNLSLSLFILKFILFQPWPVGTSLSWSLSFWHLPIILWIIWCFSMRFMGFSKQEYRSCLPFPSPVDHILSDISTTTCPSWVAPRAWLSFIELDKAVVLVWLDWLVFCEYGFSVSALWCPLATPSVLLGVSYLGHGGSLHGCSSKAQLDEGYLLTTALPDLQRGIAPLGPDQKHSGGNK